MDTEELFGRLTNHQLMILGPVGKRGKVLDEALLRPREGLIGVLMPFEGPGVQLATVPSRYNNARMQVSVLGGL